MASNVPVMSIQMVGRKRILGIVVSSVVLGCARLRMVKLPIYAVEIGTIHAWVTGVLIGTFELRLYEEWKWHDILVIGRGYEW
jgi:hypothetical protein